MAETLDAAQVLAYLAKTDAAMHALENCPIDHISRRTPDGPVRVDDCPCPRTGPVPPDVLDEMSPAQRAREVGAGRYVSSDRHTLADLVRDTVKGA